MCAYQDGLCLAGAGAWASRLQDKIVARTVAGEPLVRVDAFAAACADRELSEIRVRSITYVDQQGPKAIIEWETVAGRKASASTKTQSEERKPVIINSRP
jgi:trans-aconitate methyltransferase